MALHVVGSVLLQVLAETFWLDWGWVIESQKHLFQWFSTVSSCNKTITPRELAWKTKSENDYFFCVPFCLGSRGHLERCVFTIHNPSEILKTLRFSVTVVWKWKNFTTAVRKVMSCGVKKFWIVSLTTPGHLTHPHVSLSAVVILH